MAQYDDENIQNYEYYDKPSYGYDRGREGSSYTQTDYAQTSYSQTEQTRNWTEVLAGGLIAAAGLYLVTRGLQERPERNSLLSQNRQGNRNQQNRDKEGGIQVRESVTIDKPASELYSYWRDLSNLPDIMRHLKTVEETSETRSHWVAKGPLNTSLEWDAEITQDNENSSLAWKSVDNSQIPNEGSVYFKDAPGGRGTEIHVSLTYHPPLGPVGAGIAKLFGEEPSQQVGEDLKRFKQRMETGEVATTKGQPQGNS